MSQKQFYQYWHKDLNVFHQAKLSDLYLDHSDA